MTFKVTYEDGREVESVAKAKDFVAFERQYGQSMAAFGNPEKPAPMEWLFYLAWSPLHRQGRDPRAFDEFLSDVDVIDPVEDEDPVPFEKAPSGDPSSG